MDYGVGQTPCAPVAVMRLDGLIHGAWMHTGGLSRCRSFYTRKPDPTTDLRGWQAPYRGPLAAGSNNQNS